MISGAFEDIRVGEKKITEPRTITESYVNDFAMLTMDTHPLHLDPDYAAKTRFGRRIAHGALMISTLLGLVELDPRYMQCFYSLDEVRFLAPTYFGDTVYASSEIVDVQTRSDGKTALVSCRGSLVNQSGTEVLSGLFTFLVAGHSHAINTSVE
ncbi:MaoC/PaaZ C-terminal domain-containing protein [Rhodococcus wratislaviensis]|uniref:MaoC-like domain-containing protein n=1 Tax=Rhodococcus wratislaviensis NBRC 100605 TaxID=1219028 RepID=X0QF39_RHOWR|nr:MaoC/PaaZ C-terminal domain-containing protein [Rhodococcus wratislaviensis]GAF49481.1 hypothetical protein RW1_087_00080 [Rhodococcus wratislaviensis NBRC 100605]